MGNALIGRWRAALRLASVPALLAAAMFLAPSAGSTPPTKGPCLNLSAAVVCVDDPPGMNYNAIPLQACTDASGRFIFGRGPDGQALVCAGYPSVWNPAPTLFGQQAVGGVCPYQLPGIAVAAAQTVDGRPLICGQRGWFIN